MYQKRRSVLLLIGRTLPLEALGSVAL